MGGGCGRRPFRRLEIGEHGGGQDLEERMGSQSGHGPSWASLGTSLSAVGVGVVGLVSSGPHPAAFVLFVVLLGVYGFLDEGSLRPVRQAYLNEHILPPSVPPSSPSTRSSPTSGRWEDSWVWAIWPRTSPKKRQPMPWSGLIHLLAVPLYGRTGTASAPDHRRFSGLSPLRPGVTKRPSCARARHRTRSPLRPRPGLYEHQTSAARAVAVVGVFVRAPQGQMETPADLLVVEGVFHGPVDAGD